MSELFKLKNGTVLVSTEAPGGIYNSAQLKKIADLCSKELAIVKATEDQRLALFVKEDELEHVISELKATGLGFRNYQSGLHQPVSCLGELCETHDQPALTTAMDLTRLIADYHLQTTLKIGINGCARCCTPCHTLDISVVGEPSGYRISLGGKASQFPELASFFADSVPAKELPRLIGKIIEVFNDKAEAGESLNEVLERCGVEDFVTALAPYSQDAAGRDDPFAISENAEVPALEDTEEPSAAEDTADTDLESLIGDDDFMDLEVEGSSETMEPSTDGEGNSEFVPGDESEMTFEFEDSPMDSAHLGEIPIGDSAASALHHEVLLRDDDGEVLDEISESEPDLMELEVESLPEELTEGEEATETALMPVVTDDADEFLDPIEDEPLLIADTDDDTEVFEAIEEKIEETELATEVAPTDEADVSGMAELEIEDELIFDDSALISEDLATSDSDLLDGDFEADVPDLNTEVSEIPELDEDLLQSNEIDATTLLVDDGDEGDMMSSEDEQLFEQKIQASIDEEKKMRDGIEEDISNQSAREDAFRMLESAADEPEVALAPKKKDKASSSSRTPSFEFCGFDITDRTMRLNYSSGAYIDVSLDTVDAAQSKVFRMGGQEITVMREAEGYFVDVDGMRMFYPLQSLRAVS